ncbi:hypothetical protein [Eubacterium sp.]|uniref:hypothetical protein n=1 Tax=Eubacterium sp. TaxID=142586 RepID=UPI003F11E02B
MKIKKLIAVLISFVLVTSSVMSVSAAELSDVTPDNSTEVKANIVDPGFVSYVITIPATADFGTLTQPDSTENDNYTFYGFQVEATELNIRSNNGVSVYMKDSASDDNQFYIKQKDVESPFTMAYNVYNKVVNDANIATSNALNLTATPGSYGYHICTFTYGSQGSTQDVTLALDQNAMYGQNLSDIAGDYSGTILFHSALIEIGG